MGDERPNESRIIINDHATLPEHMAAKTWCIYCLFLWIRNQVQTGFTVCVLVCHTASGKVGLMLGTVWKGPLPRSLLWLLRTFASLVALEWEPQNFHTTPRFIEASGGGTICEESWPPRGQSQSFVTSPLIVARCCWLEVNGSQRRNHTHPVKQ